MVRSIGICTRYQNVESLNYEKYALLEEAKKLYDTVILIDTRQVTYKFLRDQKKPVILYAGQDISDLSSLHIRTTANRETSTCLLAHALTLCGCDIFDPIDRFSVGYSSKLLSTLKRFKQGVGTSSFFSFNYENTLSLLQELHRKNFFPLIVKPIAGKQGKDIQVLQDLDLAKTHANIFFNQLRSNEDEPLFIQTYEPFVEEYRVLIIDGVVLGVVKKIPNEGVVVANAAQGATFVEVENPDLVKFLLPYVHTKGVLGVDVGVGLSGDFHIIETNWAPCWHSFESATKINVAKVILQRSFDRLNK